MSSSVGGKIQIEKYRIDANYFYSMSRQYSIPEDWDEEQIEGFQRNKTLEIREQVEPLAQAEVDALMEQADHG